MKRSLSILAAALVTGSAISAPVISTTLAHPIFRQPYSCSEHWQGNLKGLGDELGTDCWIQELVEVDGRTWMRAYVGDGSKNEDWYGYGKDVLSPCTCEVVGERENRVVNSPGMLGKPPASMLVLKTSDGVTFVLAHVAGLQVKAGDKVDAGQPVAHVGNNGYSRQPHIHIGAYRGQEPLQIRFDQVSMGKLFEK